MANASGTLEIEKRFLCPPLLAESLETGQLCVPSHFQARSLDEAAVQLEDVYFDSPEFALCSAGLWLRKRNGAWQLKVAEGAENATSADCFREFEGDAAIDRVNIHFQSKNLGEQRSSLKPFVFVRSSRRSFTVAGPNGRVRVDIDRMYLDDDEKYDVAEIEVEKCDFPSAVETLLDEVAVTLNLSQSKPFARSWDFVAIAFFNFFFLFSLFVSHFSLRLAAEYRD